MTQKKATEAAPMQCKYSNNCRHVKGTVRNLFLTKGMRYTAVEINRFTNSNDARKIISILRREGMNIQDIILKSGCKLYWLEGDKQLNLWGNSNERCND